MSKEAAKNDPLKAASEAGKASREKIANDAEASSVLEANKKNVREKLKNLEKFDVESNVFVQKDRLSYMRKIALGATKEITVDAELTQKTFDEIKENEKKDKTLLADPKRMAMRRLFESYDKLYKQYIIHNGGEKYSFPKDQQAIANVVDALIGMRFSARMLKAYDNNILNTSGPNFELLPMSEGELLKRLALVRPPVARDQKTGSVRNRMIAKATELFQDNVAEGGKAAPKLGGYRLILRAALKFPDDGRIASLADFCTKQVKEVYAPKSKIITPSDPLTQQAAENEALDALAWVEEAHKTLLAYAQSQGPDSPVLAYMNNPVSLDLLKNKQPESLVAEKKNDAATAVPPRLKESSKPPVGTPEVAAKPDEKKMKPEIAPARTEPTIIKPSVVPPATVHVEPKKPDTTPADLPPKTEAIKPAPQKLSQPTPSPEAKVAAQPGAKAAVTAPETISQKRTYILPADKNIFIKTKGSQHFYLQPQFGYASLSVGGFADAVRSPDGHSWILTPRTSYENAIETSFDQQNWKVLDGMKSAEAKVESEEDKALRRQFEDPVEQKKLTDRVNGLFKKYAEGLGSLEHYEQYGGSVRWQAYRAEGRQKLTEYDLSLDNYQSFSATPEKRRQMLAAIDQFAKLLDQYDEEKVKAKWKKNSPKKEESSEKVALTKGPWMERAKNLVARDGRIRETYFDGTKRGVKEMNETVQQFHDTISPYWAVYGEEIKKSSPDPLILNELLNEIEKLMNDYETKMAKELKAGLDERAKRAEEPASATDGLSQMDDGKNELPSTIDKNALNGAKSALLSLKFNKNQSSLAVRTELMKLASNGGFKELSKDEVYALVYLKVHLPKVAGSDGKFNPLDVPELVEALTNDAYKNRPKLRDEICMKKGFERGSNEYIGVSKALGVIPLMTQQECEDYNKAIWWSSGPLRMWLFSSFQPDGLQRFQQAQYQLSQLPHAQAQIAQGVRDAAREELHKGFAESKVGRSGSKDTGDRRITLEEMKELQKQLKIAENIGKNEQDDLPKISELTGRDIEIRNFTGPSLAAIEAKLAMNIDIKRPTGLPPDVNFRIGERKGGDTSVNTDEEVGDKPKGWFSVPKIFSKKQKENSEKAEATLGNPDEKSAKETGVTTTPLASTPPEKATPKQEKKKDDGLKVVPSRPPSKSAAEKRSTVTKGIPSATNQPNSVVEEELESPFTVVDSEPEPQSEKTIAFPKIISIPGVSINKQQREICVPVTESFTVTYNPNPQGIPPTYLKPDRVMSLQGTALDAKRYSDLWVLQIKPGYEKSVIVTRDSDGSVINLDSIRSSDNALSPNKTIDTVAEAQDTPEIGMINITSFKQLDKIVSSSKKRILIDFSATWCLPCQKMETPLKNLKKDHLILAVDSDANQDIVKAYKVDTLPHFAIVQNGMILQRILGLTTESTLRASLRDPNEGKSPDSILSSATPPPPK